MRVVVPSAFMLSDLLKGLVSGRNFPTPVGAEKLEQGRGESKPKGEHVAEGVAYPRGSEGAPWGRGTVGCVPGWGGGPGSTVPGRGGGPGSTSAPSRPISSPESPANAHGWELQTSLAHGGHPGGIETEGFLFPPMIPLWT